MKRIFVPVFLGMLAVGLTACGVVTPAAPTAKQTQAQKAAQAANSVRFTSNAEIDNIKDRLELTSDPGLLGFIILLNETGSPILYEGVKGKITSGAKRLTKPWDKVQVDCGQYNCDAVVEAPSDEGTYGHSAPYIFYRNTAGEYRQWNGKYLYSDKPFRLTIEPLAVSLSPNASPDAKP